VKGLPALLAVVLLLSGCATDVGYLLRQGGYLLSYSTGGRDLGALLRDPRTPADTRAFLTEVQDIRRFASARIGLAVSASYSRYKEIDRDHLADVVQACDAVSFTPYEWTYPILGRLPYKGFYRRPDAEAEASRLRGQGYDVVVREVDAFSTLGILRDPLYSFMKAYSPFRIASLIIHEQTHATVFLRGQAGFNEELATLVGDEGAFLYLKEKYGPGSPEYREAQDSQADSLLLLEFLKSVRATLETLYASGLPRSETLAEKRRIIEEAQERYRQQYLPRYQTKGYRSVSRLPLNNAYISLYALYTDDVPILREYWERVCGGDLRLFMLRVKEIVRAPGDPLRQIREQLGH
jgi:predicted aminopeptidase